MSHEGNLFEEDGVRTLLDSLLERSKLYRSGADYKALLDFVVRLRQFAPFNAMLLQIQKPGLRYAASEFDWNNNFERRVKAGARPLLILWPFGPVALVYDLVDTEGREVPEDVWAFRAKGSMEESRLKRFGEALQKKDIQVAYMDAGDGRAGSIEVIGRSTDKKTPSSYRVMINTNHEPAVQFATLAHELAHLFLGHLGLDKYLNIPDREHADKGQREIEAESVAYLVCARNGVQPKSEPYLAHYVKSHPPVAHVDVYQVMRAAGQIETLLGLTRHTKFQ